MKQNVSYPPTDKQSSSESAFSTKWAIATLLVTGPFAAVSFFWGVKVASLIYIAIALAVAVYGWYPTTRLSHLPAPPTKWFVGNLPEMASKGYHQLDLEYSLKYGPVVRVLEGRNPWVIVSDPQLLQEVLFKQFLNFHDRADVFTIKQHHHLLWAKGSYWDWTRRALTPAFNTTKLREFAPHINAAVKGLVDRLDKVKPNESINMHRWWCDMTLAANFRTTFGVSMEQGDLAKNLVNQKDDVITATLRLIQLSDPSHIGQLLHMVAPFLIPILRSLGLLAFMNEIVAAFDTLDGCTLAMVKQRRKEEDITKFKDFLTLLLQAQDPTTGRTLNDEEVTDQGNLFLIAGYETTGSALAYACFCITTHPEIEQKVMEEINRLCPGGVAPTYDQLSQFEYLEMCINESMRVYPPAPRGTRECLNDTYLGEHFIPKGTKIVLPFYALHHNPDVWPEPDVFRPERFSEAESAKRHPCAHLPFGGGRRMCLGNKFAMEEVKLALVNIFQRYRFKIDTSKTPLPLRLTPRVTMSPTDGINMFVLPRNA